MRCLDNEIDRPEAPPAPRPLPDATSARLRQPADVAPFRCIQIGTEWFPERPGGLQRYFGDLLIHLDRAGVEPFGLVAGSAGVARQSEGRVRAFARADAPLLTRWRAARRLYRTLAAELVVSHSPVYAFPLLSLLGDRPLVSHFHGPWAAESGQGPLSPKALIERRVQRRAQRCIVLSRAFARLLREGCGVPAERIHVIPGGVELSRFQALPTRSAARETLNWPRDRPVVLAVRRLVQRVGLQDLLQAAVAVRRRIPEVLIMIGGQGPLQAMLEASIRSLGIEANVRLLGHIGENLLPTAYRAADLSILPSRALEGFGLSAAESLAAGTPVLVTPIGGAPEVVQPLCADLVIDGTGDQPVAAALIDALTGRLRLPSGPACASYAAARFDWRRVAEQIVDVYRSALR